MKTARRLSNSLLVLAYVGLLDVAVSERTPAVRNAAGGTGGGLTPEARLGAVKETVKELRAKAIVSAAFKDFAVGGAVLPGPSKTDFDESNIDTVNWTWP